MSDRYPNLKRAMDEGRINGENVPDPRKRKCRCGMDHADSLELLDLLDAPDSEPHCVVCGSPVDGVPGKSDPMTCVVCYFTGKASTQRARVLTVLERLTTEAPLTPSSQREVDALLAELGQ